MSWFSELAGKAEDFLNKVDQGAATALAKSKDDDTVPEYITDRYSESQFQNYGAKHEVEAKATGSFIVSAADNIKKQKATILAGTANVNAGARTFTDTPSAGPVPPVRPSSQFVRPKKSAPDDELLFDFLNSSEKVESKREKPKPVTPPTHSRTSSMSSVSTGTFSIKTTEDNTNKDQGNDTPESSDSGFGAQVEVTKEESSSSTPANSIPYAKDDSHLQELSNLRLENQLLRSEVQSLNQEMALLIQRSKSTQEELNKARGRIEKSNSDNVMTDRHTRELRAQVDDLLEAVTAKDSQLAVLKVRLDEADQLLKSRTDALEALQNERSRLIQDHSEGSSMHNQALQSLQDQLHEVESTLKREQESYKQMQSEFAARLNKMEAERQSLVEALNAAEKRSTEEKRKADDFQQQAKIAKSNMESAKLELADYKQKATRILQSKEKLISSLKEGAGIEGLDNHAATVVEIEELRHERDVQREEVQKVLAQIHQLRTEMQDMETQQVAETESTREQIQELQEQISMLKRNKQDLETELEKQKQEYKYIEEELYRTRNSFQSRIKDREDEIQKLRNQLTNKHLSNSSQTELENRLHQLTETLIQKQTMLEALGTEKSSLVFQLERLEQQLKTVQGNTAIGPSINMSGVDSGEGTRLRNVPVLFSDTDTNAAGVYGKVRKAASTIDRFSIRLGIFLRRYPIVRVFVIIYMALLHLWVMIVLLTYTPEMHSEPPGS